MIYVQYVGKWERRIQHILENVTIPTKTFLGTAYLRAGKNNVFSASNPTINMNVNISL